MDEMMIIGICLIWTGAVFFGFPIGWHLGIKRERRRFENEYLNGNEHIPAIVQNLHSRSDRADILNADILEEVK